MNFSLPPTPLEDAFKGNTLLGTKAKSIVTGQMDFMNEWYTVHGRLTVLKSKMAAGGQHWSTELEEELRSVEKKIAVLYKMAEETGITMKDSKPIVKAPGVV